MDFVQLLQFSYYFCILLSILQCTVSVLSNLGRVFISFLDTMLSLNFRLCSMSPCTVSLDDQTTMHFWTPNHRQLNKPTLVLIHGYGGNSRWQFFTQVWPLSRSFNLYVPDLLFFGESYTNWTDRSELFQARCIREGLKRLSVNKFSVVGISYGGYVTYRMAEIYQDEVEKVVIMSSGICYTDDQKEEQLKKIGRNVFDLIVPEKAQDMRLFMNLCIYKSSPFKLIPNFFLMGFVQKNRKEKLELAEYMLSRKADPNLPILPKKTLLIWGEKDNIFPVFLAHQLQRHLGPKSRLAILKDSGHAVIIDLPNMVNELIKSFVLG
ncbi:hypothetical protein ACB094_05G015300 [Castanea mollissima]